jgi:hypothetical protein
MNAIPIRCPNHKPHGIYSECGSFLCAIDHTDVYVRCATCKKEQGNWFRLYRDNNDGLIVQKMPTDFKMSLTDELKVIE